MAFNLGGGGGLFGGTPNPYQMPQVPYSQNPLITSAAFGLLGGRTLNEGLQNVAQLAPAGLAAKTAMQRDMAGQQDVAQKRLAMNAIIKLKSNQPITPEEQAAINAAPEVYLEHMQPSGFRQATPQEAAQYGATGGQFGPDGRFYPINPPSGTNFTVNPDGTISYTQGPGVAGAAPGNRPITTGAAGNTAQEIDDLQIQKEQVERIGELYDPELLTYQRKGRVAWARQADKLGVSGPEDRKVLAAQTRFENNVNQVFNKYRHDITGAGAALAELERLKDAVINTDQSPEEFKASMGEFARALERGINIKTELINAGIPQGTVEFSKRFEQEFLSGTASEPTSAPVYTDPDGVEVYEE